MHELLVECFPYTMKSLPMLWRSTVETLQMTFWSGSISFVLGLALGVLLIVTRRGGLMENRLVYEVLDKSINLFRSIPFIILLFCLLPLTRLISGTAIGVQGAIVPLVFGTVPFLARQMESALSEVSPGLVEAAQAMGCGRFDIICRVYLRESIPSIARGVTITLISLIGLTAMAGAVGAGGLGNFAYVYGQQRSRMDIIYSTVIVLVVIVTVIQLLGSLVARISKH